MRSVMIYWLFHQLIIDSCLSKSPLSLNMIVSHEHKYIFFAVPKTATHAIREVLRQSKGSSDWEQQQLFGKQVLPITEIASLGHGHISVKEIQATADYEQWQGYFKFAFVRNPYDRFVSACVFLNRGNPQFKQHATQWMRVAMTRPQFRQRILIRPQCELLMNAYSELALDFLGRYENLQTSLDQVLDHLLLPRITLDVRNRSDHFHYRHYYDPVLKQQVRTFYQQDLDLFEYEF